MHIASFCIRPHRILRIMFYGVKNRLKHHHRWCGGVALLPNSSGARVQKYANKTARAPAEVGGGGVSKRTARRAHRRNWPRELARRPQTKGTCGHGSRYIYKCGWVWGCSECRPSGVLRTKIACIKTTETNEQRTCIHVAFRHTNARTRARSLPRAFVCFMCVCLK